LQLYLHGAVVVAELDTLVVEHVILPPHEAIRAYLVGTRDLKREVEAAVEDLVLARDEEDCGEVGSVESQFRLQADGLQVGGGVLLGDFEHGVSIGLIRHLDLPHVWEGHTHALSDVYHLIHVDLLEQAQLLVLQHPEGLLSHLQFLVGCAKHHDCEHVQ